MFIPMAVVVIVCGVLMIRFMGSWIMGGVVTAVGCCMAGAAIPFLSPVVNMVRGVF